MHGIPIKFGITIIPQFGMLSVTWYFIPILVCITYFRFNCVRHEFRTLLNHEGRLSVLLDNWSTWRVRIIKFAHIESTNRREVKKLLEDLDSISEEGENLTLLTLPGT